MTASAKLLIARKIINEAKTSVKTLDNSKRIQVLDHIPELIQEDEWISLVSMDTNREIAGIGGHAEDWITETADITFNTYTSQPGRSSEDCWDRIDELTSVILDIARKDRSSEVSLTASEGSGIVWWFNSVTTEGPTVIVSGEGFYGMSSIDCSIRLEII